MSCVLPLFLKDVVHAFLEGYTHLSKIEGSPNAFSVQLRHCDVHQYQLVITSPYSQLPVGSCDHHMITYEQRKHVGILQMVHETGQKCKRR